MKTVGSEREDVPLEARIDVPHAAARHLVASDSRMREGDIPGGEARDDVLLDEDGVASILRDAVAVEDDPVAIVEREVLRNEGRQPPGPGRERERRVRGGVACESIAARPIAGRGAPVEPEPGLPIQPSAGNPV